MNITEGLSYDDVLLVPKYSTIKSRDEVDTSVKLPKIGTTLKHPIIPANMKSVAGYNLAVELIKSGGLYIHHRFEDIGHQTGIFHELKKQFIEDVSDRFGFSVGVKEDQFKLVDYLVDMIGARILCVDVAHGDSLNCHVMCEYIAKKYPKVLLIAGNVVTGEAAVRMWNCGVDICKIGVGSGSICTTRIQTGNGMSTMTTISNVAKAKEECMHISSLSLEKFHGHLRQPNLYFSTYFNVFKEQKQFPKEMMFIADGGIKTSGDICKSLCFANMVMVGNLFAGTEESPGEKIVKDRVTYKKHSGSSTHKSSYVEGVEGYVKCEGKFNDVLEGLLQGLRSGMSYQNAKTLEELRKYPEFVKITNSGLIESHAHDLKYF